MICSIRLVRFSAERKRSFWDWKIDPDHGQAEDHAQRGEVALDERAGRRLGAPVARGRSVRAALARAARRGRRPSPLSVADAGDRRDDVLLGRSLRPRSRRPARPSRRTTIRSATSKTSARLWLITTTPRPRSRRRLISVEHLRGLRHAERRRRLVEQHDLRLAEQRAGDRDLLALAAGERPDLACAGSGSSPRGWRAARRVRCSIVASSSWRETCPAPGRDLLLAEEEVGDDVEVVAEREVLVDGRDPELGRVLRPRDRDLARRRSGSSPSSAAWMPAIVLTSVDLPAPLSPTRPTTSPAWTAKSTRSRAWTGPKRLLTPSSARSGAVGAHRSAPLLGDPRFLAGLLRRRRCRVRRRSRTRP